MHVIAFISQKGGVGKTTLAIHLAMAFVGGGYNTVLLDLDPQASAAEWKDPRQNENPPSGSRCHAPPGPPARSAGNHPASSPD